ncbi:MAG: hypothetical protein ACE5OR_01240, partial [bacterium]
LRLRELKGRSGRIWENEGLCGFQSVCVSGAVPCYSLIVRDIPSLFQEEAKTNKRLKPEIRSDGNSALHSLKRQGV